MDTKELRIENLVYNNLGQTFKVKGIHKDYDWDINDGWDKDDEYYIDESDFISYSGSILKPIPLTEEWLTKFGFTEAMYDYTVHTGEFYNNKIGLLKIVGGDKYQLSMASKNLMVVIEYVHQLQNLYFALTGEELTLIPLP